jgi:deoxyribodipyrimidine photo-lyase
VSFRFSRSICWLRRDLRVYDHAALAAATQSSESVTAVFVFDRCILDQLADRNDRRLSFIHQSLQDIDSHLREVGSQLVVLQGDPSEEIPKLAQAHQYEAVFCARDYEPYARTRDTAVAQSLGAQGVTFHSVRDTILLDPEQIETQSGTPFKVYSPFARAWRAEFDLARDAADHAPNFRHITKAEPWMADHQLPSLADLGFEPTELWIKPGEKAGRAMLTQFSDQINEYASTRDFPATLGTSKLSPHLRFGTISIRDAARTALAAGKDGDKWFAELIWREFYQHILWHFPQVVEHAFQEQYQDLVWPGDPSHWIAWTDGQTGYPIVDAAMRCFNATGWMHNRLRMVVASFLTKDLLLDYRLGEAYFARYLLDFDLASNNGGWQWAASTGCDAQPYFRIFNPMLQSRKFDPEGAFIRHWLPELADLDSDAVHAPWEASEFERLGAGVILGDNYPYPIVDHATQKARAIALLESKKKNVP